MEGTLSKTATRLININELAKQVGSRKQAMSLLRKSGIPVLDGFYDDKLLTAVASADTKHPSHKQNWGLSPLMGLGAVKSVLDSVKADILVHEQMGQTQHLVLTAGRGNTKRRLKLHRRSRQEGHLGTHFQVRNFFRDDCPTRFLMVNSDEQTAWVITRVQLRNKFVRAQRMPYYYENDDAFCIPYRSDSSKQNPHGILNLNLTEKSPYLLKNRKQLGL